MCVLVAPGVEVGWGAHVPLWVCPVFLISADALTGSGRMFSPLWKVFFLHLIVKSSRGFKLQPSEPKKDTKHKPRQKCVLTHARAHARRNTHNLILNCYVI